MNTITEEKIIETAERLTAEGKNPTQVTVRAALGGGSFATIGPVLKSWKNLQKEDHSLAEIQVPEAITERLEQLQGAVWKAAVDEAERRLTAEREALKVAQEAAAAEVAEQQESVAALEAEADQLRQKIEELKENRRLDSICIKDVSTELAQLKEQSQAEASTQAELLVKEGLRADAAVDRAERAEDLHDAAQQQARTDRDAMAMQGRNDVSELKKTHESDLEKLKKEMQQARSAADAAVKKAEVAEQEAQRKAEQLEKELQQQMTNEQVCQSHLNDVQKRMAQLEERSDKAIQEAAELRGELKALQSMNNPKKPG